MIRDLELKGPGVPCVVELDVVRMNESEFLIRGFGSENILLKKDVSIVYAQQTDRARTAKETFLKPVFSRTS